ncbi:hypothetical protein PanWU01x14_166330 [Parasponia andersonii]|uniref:Uncharacterized protein n=1 Tax=Parasponia andersonii TaxID=3476 RepID=A0A2P5CBL6_PARAD|nr:hypothetical protein PanWU01x14_166330 [Parasponia andersonii]
MPMVLGFKIQQSLCWGNKRLDLQEIAKCKLRSQHRNPENSILDIINEPFPQATTHKYSSVEPPCQPGNYPPIQFLDEIPNPRDNKKNQRQQLRNKKNKSNLKKRNNPPVGFI